MITSHQQQQKWSLGDALDVLARHVPALAVDRAERLGGGIEFQVYRIVGRGGETLVAKFPTERWVFNDNDQGLDNFQLLDQERVLLGFSRAHAIPAPLVKDLVMPAAGPAVLLLEAIETDATVAGGTEIGRIVRRLHALPVPDIRLVAQRGRAASQTVAELTAERLAVVAQLSGPLRPVPGTDALRRLLAPIDGSVSLLHMDLRDANYLCRGGQLRGLIDWSNALIANPLLELARVAEYGNLSTDFAAGYGITARERAALDQRLGLCCRLYTAAMLAVVFLSEMPDPDVARLKVDRVRELLAGLGDPSTES